MKPEPQSITVRKIEINLAAGFARHWHGGDALHTMYYNALSMSFPVGEQFFIDSVRAAAQCLPHTPEHARVHAEVAQFVGQEASHRHVHGQYNAQLAHQGLVNRWEIWARRRLARAERHGLSVTSRLAATAAYEHCTAVFADCVLRYPDLLAAADQDMALLWRWHAAEETEHKAVACDLYRALGGSERARRLWFVYILMTFIAESFAQTCLNLWHDGSLWRRSTWRSAFAFALGPRGLMRRTALALLRYLRRGYHPDDDDNRALAADWLAAHAQRLRTIR